MVNGPQMGLSGQAGYFNYNFQLGTNLIGKIGKNYRGVPHHYISPLRPPTTNPQGPQQPYMAPPGEEYFKYVSHYMIK